MIAESNQLKNMIAESNFIYFFPLVCYFNDALSVVLYCE